MQNNVYIYVYIYIFRHTVWYSIAVYIYIYIHIHTTWNWILGQSGSPQKSTWVPFFPRPSVLRCPTDITWNVHKWTTMWSRDLVLGGWFTFERPSVFHLGMFLYHQIGNNHPTSNLKGIETSMDVNSHSRFLSYTLWGHIDIVTLPQL